MRRGPGPRRREPRLVADGKKIAFDAAGGHGVNIFTVSAGVSPVELPLRVGAFNGDPAFSRDGAHVSFDEDIGPSAPTVHGIFIANADGSGANRLTTGIRTKDAYDTQSQWSPDGKRLAWTRVKNNEQAAVFAVNVDGTEPRQLTPWNLDAANPDWSPTGGRSSSAATTTRTPAGTRTSTRSGLTEATGPAHPHTPRDPVTHAPTARASHRSPARSRGRAQPPWIR